MSEAVPAWAEQVPEWARGVPAAPPPEPPRQVGVMESMLRTAGDAARRAVGLFDMAAAGLASAIGGQSEADKVFAMREQRQQRMREAYSPKPGEQFSTAGQLAGGVISAPIEIAGGLGLQHGAERATDVIDRGGTLREAQGAGAVSSGVHAALNALPIKAGGAVGRAIESKVGGMVGGALTGGAIATAGGTAGRAVENAALPEGEQFKDLRQDVAPSAAEVGLGMALGAVPGAAAAGGAALKARKAKAAALEKPELEGVRAAHEAGYWLTPAAAKAGLVQRGVAALAGRRDLAQRMAEHNQENTARLVREDVGLPADAPITRDALASVRSEAGKGYDAVRKFGDFETDPQLKADIAKITAQTRKVADEFPTLLDSPLLDHAAAVDVPKMSTNGAIAVIRDLRNKADKAAGGTKPDYALAGAYRALAEAVDSAMDRALSRRAGAEGPEAQAALDAYREARVKIAKAYTAEDALTGVPGEVDSAVYGKAVKKNPDKLSGPSKTIGEFHNQFAQQGLAKAKKTPNQNPFHNWTLAALFHAPLSLGGTLAARAVAQGAGATEAGQRVITSRARSLTEPAPVAAAEAPPAGPAPLELAPEGPQPARPAGETPASPLGDLTPDWETAPGAAPARAVGEAVPAEGLVPAIDDVGGPARVRPAGAAIEQPPPRGAGMEIPAVPGRPDLPDAMVAGGPAEIAGTPAAGAAMQTPEAALARAQQEAARLRERTASPEVQKVLDEHERTLKRRAADEEAARKRAENVAELRRMAAEATDPELQAAFHARAAKLEGAEPLPAGKAKEIEGPKAKPAKQPDKPLPTGEATEVAPEVVEPVLTPVKQTVPGAKRLDSAWDQLTGTSDKPVASKATGELDDFVLSREDGKRWVALNVREHRQDSGRVVYTSSLEVGSEGFPKGTGAATEMYLEALRIAQKRKMGWQSEGIRSDEAMAIYRRLTEAGIPFKPDGGSAVISAEALAGVDLAGVKSKIDASKATPVKPGAVESLDVPADVRPPRTEPRVGKAGPKDKFVPGRVYRDSKGNRAIYRSDGTWKELD